MRDTDAHTVRHKALLVAYGLNESGRREVIGIDVRQVESEALEQLCHHGPLWSLPTA